MVIGVGSFTIGEMSRTTHLIYLFRRDALAANWKNGGRALCRLTIPEQRALHDYYLLTMRLLDEKLRAYVAKISKDDPSLPQRAGKAWKSFERVAQLPVQVPAAPSNQHIRPVVYPLIRPELDIEALADLMVQLAIESVEEDKKDKAA